MSQTQNWIFTWLLVWNSDNFTFPFKTFLFLTQQKINYYQIQFMCAIIFIPCRNLLKIWMAYSIYWLLIVISSFPCFRGLPEKSFSWIHIVTISYLSYPLIIILCAAKYSSQQCHTLSQGHFRCYFMLGMLL